jgi:hypothetical protein
MRRFAKIVTAVAALGGVAPLALSAALAAAPAGATGRATPTSTASLQPQTVQPIHHQTVPNTVASTDGSGYFSNLGAGNLSSVSANFTMPTYSCASSEDQEWLLPGVYVYSEGKVTEQLQVNFNCNFGSNLQEAFVCLQGTTNCDGSITPEPGDKMRASLIYTASSTTATITDVTQDVSAHVTAGPITTDDVAFVGDLGPGSLLGAGITAVPTFAKVVFTQVKINGLPLAGYSPSRNNYESGSDVQITTGNIRHDGKSFETTFKRNN